MQSQSKIDLFEDTPITTAIIKLAIPTVLSALVMVIYNLADTWFVGMLNNPVENAAVTLAAPMLLAFNAVNNLFGVGTSSMMGRALGRGDIETVKRSSSFGFWAAIVSSFIFSLVFTVFQGGFLKILGTSPENIDSTSKYLFWTVTMGAIPTILNVVMAYLVRTEGASMHASIGTMSGCFLNILLDPLFVLPGGFNMGASGAGLATFISNIVACCYFFILLYIKRGKTYVCMSPKMAIPKKKIALGIFAVGIPASIQNLLNVTGMMVLNNFTAAFGSSAVAAMGISYKMNMVPMNIAMGMSQGIMPLISYNYGSRNLKRAKKTLLKAAKISTVFMLSIATIFYIFSGEITAMFIDNLEIIEYGRRFLRGMCIGLPFLCIDFTCVMTMQACGQGTISLIFAVCRKIVFEIPAIIILNMIFPLYGLSYSQTVTEFFLCIIAVATTVIFFKREEKKDLVIK